MANADCPGADVRPQLQKDEPNLYRRTDGASVARTDGSKHGSEDQSDRTLRRRYDMDAARWLVLAGILALPLAFLQQARAAETPTSYGPAATVDTPILRIPLITEAPKIDGKMEDGEWEDSSALGPFWYDRGSAHFLYLAPHQTQVRVHAAYDKENLYIAYVSNTHPENSWLKANARFPDVLFHPQYGTLWDDHIELELRPIDDNRKGFKLGLFKWVVNSFNNVVDLNWSINRGERKKYTSNILARSGTDAEKWTLELAIPLESFVYGNYEGTDEDGDPIVDLPIPDGYAFRSWFTRGIGGNNIYFNVFDNHVWNTTKTKLIFDSTAPSFQILDVGPIMDDMIDVELLVKNHAREGRTVRSRTVRIGFFVESEEGTIYSSYDAPELKDGLLEIVPGAVKTIRLRKSFPGVSRNGNVLWFDVRSAGTPAKTLFRTRLIRFHRMDGGAYKVGEEWRPFRQERLDAIEEMRPPRKDFAYQFSISSYHKRIQAYADKGINGASEEAKTAAEAKLMIFKDNPEQDLVTEVTEPFHLDFATFLVDVPDLIPGEKYTTSLLLFDKNKRIVGERNSEPWEYMEYEWQNNKLGLGDTVWEPFEPIEVTDDGFETLKHRFTLAPSGLPAQIWIKPDVRDLPLELRGEDGEVSGEVLERIGRGEQLRAPLRLEAVVGGERIQATVVEPAEPVRTWKSEVEYESTLDLAGIPVRLTVQYDCDGAMWCTMRYGGPEGVTVDSLELVGDIKGLVDTKTTSIQGGGGMAGADVWECSLPFEEGVVFDNDTLEKRELYYSKLVTWLWFGSGDRGFTWFTDNDKNYILEEGTMTTLERDADMNVTWRTRIVNHTAEVKGEREIKFSILTHPSKPKPKVYRNEAWFWRGVWADEYFSDHIARTNEEYVEKAKRVYGVEDEEELENFPTGKPPYHRYYQIRMWGWSDKEKLAHNRPNEMDRYFEDKFAFHFNRALKYGRREGFWWDESWPVKRTEAWREGEAYLRDKEDVGPNEIPWQAAFNTHYMRRFQKRFARLHKQHDIPNRNFHWANNSATCYESFSWDTQLVEECGGSHRTFEVDLVTQFPISLYRYEAHNYTGLITRANPGPPPVQAGDMKRLDRQLMGRAVMHDIGMEYVGPHGYMPHAEQCVRIVNILHDFGYFEEDAKTEFIPYWRQPSAARFDTEPQPMTYGTYVTAYRRPLEDGEGYKVLLIVMNDGTEDRTKPLVIDRGDLIFGEGGKNTFSAEEARAHFEYPEALQGWVEQALGNDPKGPVLLDMESGRLVGQHKEGQYGPVHIPFHDFRIFYAESR
jgi:hypothetical protein